MAINLSSSIWKIQIKPATRLDDDDNNDYTFRILGIPEKETKGKEVVMQHDKATLTFSTDG